MEILFHCLPAIVKHMVKEILEIPFPLSSRKRGARCHPWLNVVNRRRQPQIPNKNTEFQPTTLNASVVDQVSLSTAGYKRTEKPHEFQPGPLAHRL